MAVPTQLAIAPIGKKSGKMSVIHVATYKT
jgi:hypothetical protein